MSDNLQDSQIRQEAILKYAAEKSFIDDPLSRIWLYEEILRSVSGVIFINNQKYPGLEFASDHFESILGYKKDELKKLGVEGLRKLYHPDDFYIFSERNDFFHKPENRGKTYSTIYRIRHKKGHYIWLYFHSYVARYDEGGSPLHVCGIMLNMTHFIHDTDLLEKFLRENARKRNKGLIDMLTRREKEVLAEVGKGYSNKQIAAHLVLSVRTVETHRKNIQKKLKISNKSNIIGLAVSLGLT